MLAAPEPPTIRAVLIFNGGDPMELQDAREQWKELREVGFELAYYQEDEHGGWTEKKRVSRR